MYNAFIPSDTDIALDSYNINTPAPTCNDIAKLQDDFTNMYNAIIDLLEGTKYLWEGSDSHI